MSSTRAVRLSGARLQAQALAGVERGQVVEEDLVAGHLRRLEVDGLDLDEREVALALLGRAHLARTPCRRCAGRTCGSARARRRCRRARAGSSTPGRAGSRSRRAASPAPPPRREAALLGLALQDLEDQVVLLHPRAEPSTFISRAIWSRAWMVISLRVESSSVWRRGRDRPGGAGRHPSARASGRCSSVQLALLLLGRRASVVLRPSRRVRCRTAGAPALRLSSRAAASRMACHSSGTPRPRHGAHRQHRLRAARARRLLQGPHPAGSTSPRPELVGLGGRHARRGGRGAARKRCRTRSPSHGLVAGVHQEDGTGAAARGPPGTSVTSRSQPCPHVPAAPRRSRSRAGPTR